jgi:hypothetical protein
LKSNPIKSSESLHGAALETGQKLRVDKKGSK